MADIIDNIIERYVHLITSLYEDVVRALVVDDKMTFTVAFDRSRNYSPSRIGLNTTGNTDFEIMISASECILLYDAFCGTLLGINGPIMEPKWSFRRRANRLKEIKQKSDLIYQLDYRVARLLHVAAVWIIAHEINHYNRGHICWLDGRNAVAPLDYMAIELDADMRANESAFAYLVSGIAPPLPRISLSPQEEVTEALFILNDLGLAISCIFYIWMMQGRECQKYPPNTIRLAALWGFLIVQAKSLFFTLNDGDVTKTQQATDDFVLKMQDEIRICAKRFRKFPVENILHQLRFNRPIKDEPSFEELLSRIRTLTPEWEQAKEIWRQH